MELRVGNWVEVRPLDDILQTLDANGSLDGLPFMPEMVDWCGKALRVLRRVEQTCVDGTPKIRRFSANDVVILDMPRCSGAGHDGCSRGCRIFWKEAWLRRIDLNRKAPAPVASEIGNARPLLKTKTDSAHYHCQSTELLKATEEFPAGRNFWFIRIPLREILTRDISAVRVLKLAAVWIWRRACRRVFGEDALSGPGRQPPSPTLNLETGDRIKIKPRGEIIETLDSRRRNKGLSFCEEMIGQCGSGATVRWRVEKIIDEQTGTMRHLSNTVTLKDEERHRECMCQGRLGDCPRGELMFWREVWLQRAEDPEPRPGAP